MAEFQTRQQQFIDKVETRRRERNWSVRDLSMASGVPADTLYHLRGRYPHRIGLEIRKRLVTAFYRPWEEEKELYTEADLPYPLIPISIGERINNMREGLGLDLEEEQRWGIKLMDNGLTEGKRILTERTA